MAFTVEMSPNSSNQEPFPEPSGRRPWYGVPTAGQKGFNDQRIWGMFFDWEIFYPEIMAHKVWLRK